MSQAAKQKPESGYLSQTNLNRRIREPRDQLLEFRYSLPALLGAADRRISKNLINPKAIGQIVDAVGATGQVAATIIDNFPVPQSNILRRFLAGEFTDGERPIHLPNLQRFEIEKLLRALDVIQCMADDHDRKTVTAARPVDTENDDGENSNPAGAGSGTGSNPGVRPKKNRGNKRTGRALHAAQPSGG